MNNADVIASKRTADLHRLPAALISHSFRTQKQYKVHACKK
jgi:hypothetical protein